MSLLPPPLPPRPSLTPSPFSSSSSSSPPLQELHPSPPQETINLPPAASDKEHDQYHKVSKAALVELLSTTPKATANLITDLKPVFALWDALDYALSWKSPEITILFWLFLLALCRWFSLWSAVVPTPFVLFIGGLLVGFVDSTNANGERARRNSGLNPPSAKATVRMFYTTKLFRTFCAYLSLVRLLFLWRHPPSSRFALRTALALYPFWATGWSLFFCFPRITAGILCSTVVFWRAPVVVRPRDTIAHLPASRRTTEVLKSAWAWWCQDFFGGNDHDHASHGISPEDRNLKNVHSDSSNMVSAMYRGMREVASKGKSVLRKAYFASHKAGYETMQIDHEGWLDGFQECNYEESSANSSGYEVSNRGSETVRLKRNSGLIGKATDGSTAALKVFPGEVTDGSTDVLTVIPGEVTDGLNVIPGEVTDGSAGGLKVSVDPDSIAIFMTKQFSVFENQRWWVGLDWVPLMLPHDPPPWSDVDDLPSAPPQQFRFPPIPPGLVQSFNALSGSANREATTTRYQWRWLEPRWRFTTADEEQNSVDPNGGWEYRNHFWQNKLAKYRSSDSRISLQKPMNSSSSSLSSTSSIFTDSSSISITTSSEKGMISSKLVDPLMRIRKTTRTRTWVRRAGVVALEE